MGALTRLVCVAQFRHRYKAMLPIRSRYNGIYRSIKINNLVRGAVGPGQTPTYHMYSIHRVMALFRFSFVIYRRRRLANQGYGDRMSPPAL